MCNVLDVDHSQNNDPPQLRMLESPAVPWCCQPQRFIMNTVLRTAALDELQTWMS